MQNQALHSMQIQKSRKKFSHKNYISPGLTDHKNGHFSIFLAMRQTFSTVVYDYNSISVLDHQIDLF